MHLNPIQLIIVQTLTLTITTIAKVLILIIISIQHINTVKGLTNLKLDQTGFQLKNPGPSGYPNKKIEYKPTEKKVINYVEIQHLTDYVPFPKLEKCTEYIPVDRYIKKIDYMPVEKSYVAGQTNP